MKKLRIGNSGLTKLDWNDIYEVIQFQQHRLLNWSNCGRSTESTCCCPFSKASTPKQRMCHLNSNSELLSLSISLKWRYLPILFCICSEKCNLQSNSHIETVSECISEYPQQSVAECTRWQFGVGERVPRQGRQLDCWTLSQTMATSMGLAY